MFDVPSTVQRPLVASYFARTGPSGSGCGTSVICAVSHVGATQPAAGASVRRTRTCMTIGSAVFGNRNVSFELVVSPFSATGVPLTWDHSNFAALTEPEASSVSGRFWRTVAPTGAMTARVGAFGLTVTSTESVCVWPPLPVTVSLNVSVPAAFGAVNDGVAVSAPVSVTPSGPLQDMLSMSPAEPPPSSVTFAPWSTVWSTPASARSGRAARPAPSISTGTVTEPPLDDLTVTWSGGASVAMSTEPELPRAWLNPSTVSSVGASSPSLDEAWTWRTSPPPDAVVWYTADAVRWSTSFTFLTVCGVSPRLMRSTVAGKGPRTSARGHL